MRLYLQEYDAKEFLHAHRDLVYFVRAKIQLHDLVGKMISIGDLNGMPCTRAIAIPVSFNVYHFTLKINA